VPLSNTLSAGHLGHDVGAEVDGEHTFPRWIENDSLEVGSELIYVGTYLGRSPVQRKTYDVKAG
jgi:hypothetical protein